MADAKRFDNTRTVRETGVTLTLTDDEAGTLRAILSRISGSPTHSPREHADTIAAALNKAGVVRPANVVFLDEPRSAIRFRDYPPKTSTYTSLTAMFGSGIYG